MPVVFRFDSREARNRATLVLPDVDTALEHIRETFDLAEHSFDQDGDEPATIEKIKYLLEYESEARLFDQQNWYSSDTVDICRAGT